MADFSGHPLFSVLARLRERFGPKLFPEPCFSTRLGTKIHKNVPWAVLTARKLRNESRSRQGWGKGFGQCQFGKQHGSLRSRIGAGVGPPWRKSFGFGHRYGDLMAQVFWVLGTGVEKGWGPAPGNGHGRSLVAQVPTQESHLRHKRPTPAP